MFRSTPIYDNIPPIYSGEVIAAIRAVYNGYGMGIRVFFMSNIYHKLILSLTGRGFPRSSFLRVISIITAVIFLCTNNVWAIEIPAYKLAAHSEAMHLGHALSGNPSLGRLVLGSRLLDEFGIRSLSDIVRNMDRLAERGVICFVRPDQKGPDKTARYVFSENGVFLRITKTAEEVVTDFDELLEVSGEKEIVDEYIFEWCQISEDKVNLVNSFLGNLSDGKWSVNLTGGEYLDILNGEGNLTGERKLRDLVHREGDWHQTANIILIDKSGNLVMQRKSADHKMHPNMLTIPGGHLKSGTGHKETAIDEIKDEIGIAMKEDRMILLGYEFYDSAKYIGHLPEEMINREKRSLWLYILNDEETERVRGIAKNISKEKAKGLLSETKEIVFLPFEDVVSEIAGLDDNQKKYTPDLDMLIFRNARVIDEVREVLRTIPKAFGLRGELIVYNSIADGFVDEYEVRSRVLDDKVQITEMKGVKAQQLADLVNSALQILSDTFVSLLEDNELRQYWTELLDAEHNKGSPICVKVNSKLPVNSYRYYNSATGEIGIILNQVFIEELLSGISHQPLAVLAWLLAERLFHELGHNNRVGTLEEEREEEKMLIIKDLALHNLLISGKIPGISKTDISRYFDTVKPKFPSGYYFNFLNELLKLDPQKQKDKINSYVEKNCLRVSRRKRIKIKSLPEILEEKGVHVDDGIYFDPELQIMRCGEMGRFRIFHRCWNTLGEDDGNYTNPIPSSEEIHSFMYEVESIIQLIVDFLKAKGISAELCEEIAPFHGDEHVMMYLNIWIEVPMDKIDQVRSYLGDKFENFGSIIAGHHSDVKSSKTLKPSDIINLNDINVTTPLISVGAKGKAFGVFNKLGLPYPSGVVLSPDIVDRIRNGDQVLIEDIVDFIQHKLPPEIFRVSIRSSPIISMPGRLQSRLDISRADRDGIRRALREVAKSFNTPKAEAYRKQHNIPENSGMAIIIQGMVYGDLNNSSGSGVFSTRNPNTGEDKLFGQYLIKAHGENLMTGGESGKDIAHLGRDFPDCYRQIQEAAKKLEDHSGYPQEVEFVIESGKLYFLQTRNVKFAPQGEIKYLQDQLRSGKMTEIQLLPRLEELQKRLGQRVIYKVKKGVKAETLFNGIASTSGAIQGAIIFDLQKATDLAKQGKPIILIATSWNQDAALDIVFRYSKIGLITTYGNNSSHEAVLTCMAGIPSITNAQGISYSKNTFTCKGRDIKEGDVVVLDGDNNRVFASSEDVLEMNTIVQDASYGIDIQEYEKKFMATYLADNGEIKDEYTYERLIELNVRAKHRYDCDKIENSFSRSLFILNLEKHFLHKLLLRRANEKGISPERIRLNMEEFESSLVEAGTKASSLPRTIDATKKETVLYSIKIDAEGNILRDTADVKEPSKTDARFNEASFLDNLQKLMAYLKTSYGEGIFGPINEIVLVDNLGGIDSEIPEVQRGAATYLNGNQMLIDIDAVQNIMALMDVGVHESFEAILRLVEDNPGINEVTATYLALQSLLERTKANPADLDAYIAFLKQPNNGLDSSEYALLLEHLRDTRDTLDDKGLRALAIGYVLSTPRYEHLQNSLKGILDSDITKAERKIELAKGIYADIIKAKRAAIEELKGVLKPAIAKVKIADVKLKIKMVTSKWAFNTGFLDKLHQAGKFIRLDVDELVKPENKYMIDWLKGLKAQQQEVFVFYSRSGKGDAEKFIGENSLAGKDYAKLVGERKVEMKDIVTLVDLSGVDTGKSLADGKSLYLPYLYSISGVYLAAQIVIAEGDIGQIQDNLIKTTLVKTYEALFGETLSPEDLNKLFQGQWPKAYKITESINALRNAIAQIEIAA